MILALKRKLKRIVNMYIPLNIFIINFIFQRIFRIDANLKYSKNYTSRVIGSSNLYIENNSRTVLKSLALSGGCYIQASEGIYIGENTIWSFNVCIISQDHDISNFENIPISEPIRIGRRCWIGANTTILPGINLGDNTVVGANTVVTKSFPEGNVVIAGNPAKIIRELN